MNAYAAIGPVNMKLRRYTKGSMESPNRTINSATVNSSLRNPSKSKAANRARKPTPGMVKLRRSQQNVPEN